MDDCPKDGKWDTDLAHYSVCQLRDMVMELRTAIRKHRDSTGHDLCWYHPELWLILPEKTLPCPQVPSFCEFIQNCASYRQSLEKQPPKSVGYGYSQWEKEPLEE